MKNTKQTAKAHDIIFALLHHHSQEKAAASLNMSVKTLRRWLNKPEFHALYFRARRDRHRQLKARAQQVAPAAVQVLLELMGDQTHGAAAQFRACRSVALRADSFEFEQGQILHERLDRIFKEEIQNDCSPSLLPKAKSELSCVVKETARKAGSTADKMNRIVLAMIQHGGNREKAAIACGIDAVTIWRWMKKTEVQELYRHELRAEYLRAQILMQFTANMAFSIMERMMKDPKTPASVRLQIAQFMLDVAHEGAGEDLDERNEALEKAKKKFEKLA